MIQDIFPCQYKKEYMPGQSGDESAVLVYDGRKILLKKEEEAIIFPSYREVREYKGEGKRRK